MAHTDAVRSCRSRPTGSDAEFLCEQLGQVRRAWRLRRRRPGRSTARSKSSRRGCVREVLEDGRHGGQHRDLLALDDRIAVSASHLRSIATFCPTVHGTRNPLNSPVAWNSGTVTSWASAVAPPRNSARAAELLGEESRPGTCSSAPDPPRHGGTSTPLGVPGAAGGVEQQGAVFGGGCRGGARRVATRCAASRMVRTSNAHRVVGVLFVAVDIAEQHRSSALP